MKNEFFIKDVFEKRCLLNRDSESAVIGSLLNNTVKIEEVLLYLNPTILILI
ncbi:hypothetical protein [Borreliella lanei]|uniref:Uncharacterized protein n=1 Tax=Borreliella lanei TaxID=373540 RepID=A0A7X0DK17_9SPIR|nr:hypothetical protein [Borreliella lanei]MBB6208500.1 hypothetical protein [Borreliella lanei]